MRTRTQSRNADFRSAALHAGQISRTTRMVFQGARLPTRQVGSELQIDRNNYSSSMEWHFTTNSKLIKCNFCIGNYFVVVQGAGNKNCLAVTRRILAVERIIKGFLAFDSPNCVTPFLNSTTHSLLTFTCSPLAGSLSFPFSCLLMIPLAPENPRRARKHLFATHWRTDILSICASMCLYTGL